MEKNEQDELTRLLRQPTFWVAMTALAGSAFIVLTICRMMQDRRSMNDEMVVFTVFFIAVIFLTRYIVMLLVQRAVSRNNGLPVKEKLDKYYARSFVFWLMEGIISLVFTVLFLFIVLEEYHMI